MDWNRPGKLLRSNPDWEEDLLQTLVAGPEEEARLKSYVEDALKKTHKEDCYCYIEESKLQYMIEKRKLLKKGCSCQNTRKPGTAPLITLNNGIKIPSLGLGTWLGLDKQGNPAVLKDFSIQKAVETAIDIGYRLIDTAASYNTEIQVGRAIKKKIREGVVRREDLFIITKLWNDCHAKEAVIPALKESLHKLDLDYLDLYLVHWPIGVRADGKYDDVDYLETWEGMAEARARGFTKSVGVSNFNERQLDRILSLSTVKPAVLQVELNLSLQQFPLLSFCRSHDVAVMGYSPLGSLAHSRAARDAPVHVDSPGLVQIADKYHKTSAQIALRYLIDIGVIPMPKSVTPYHLWQNIDVFNFALTKYERQVLREFDRNYRVMSVPFWKNSPHYPFEK